jgi:Tol biopolymer transport system component
MTTRRPGSEATTTSAAAKTRFICAVLLLVATALVAPPAALGTFPGTNGKIYFDRSAIFGVASDGSGLTQVTGSGYNASLPAVSPNGNVVAFRRSGSPGYGIWTINVDGTGARQVSTDPQNIASNDTDPTWSPDGSKIAFVRNGELHVMNADGSGRTVVVGPGFPFRLSDPEWSPTGNEIAFAANNQIWAVGAGGTPGPTQLNPTAPGNRSNPSWSPNGGVIAYTRGPPGANGGIWTINRATAPNETRLLVGAAVGEVWELAWSPDGTKIGYISDVGGPFQEELFTVNADGSGVTRLNVDASVNMDWGKASSLLPPPVVGRTVNVAVASGKVFVSVPAGSAFASVSVPGIKGRRFVALTAARQLPVGSILDTRRGSLSLTAASTKAGEVFSGTFSAGVFQALQSRSGLTTLPLKGSSFRPCAARAGRASAALLSRRVIRRLRSNASGRYRTRGRYSAATVRGTIWETIDRCDGTLTKVTRGTVLVRDFRKRRNITVRAGKSYLARAPG